MNRPVLVSNLVAGAFWLAVLGLIGAPGLALIAAPYVVVASLYFATFYARESYTRRQEALAWFLPWLGAIALWGGILLQIGGGELPSVPLFLAGALFVSVVATPCYLAWQLLALAVRQYLAYRARIARPTS